VIINQIFAHYHLDEFRILLSPRGAEASAAPVPPPTDDDDAGAQQTTSADPVVVSSIMIHPSISPLYATPVSANLIMPCVRTHLTTNRTRAPHTHAHRHENNPSFRYYHYYRETGAIADYAHFYLDLALVNLLPAPRWVLEYTFRGAYAVRSLPPARACCVVRTRVVWCVSC
jgi:hypothetical protein